MSGNQKGSLRKEDRKYGKTWILRYYATRNTDGRRVEHTTPVGLVSQFRTEKQAWGEVERLELDRKINKPDFNGKPITFGDLARHYEEHELDRTIDPLSHTTVSGYKRNLRLRILPRWGARDALSIKALEIQEWLEALKRKQKLKDPTLDRQRRIMSSIYRSAQKYDLISGDERCNPLNRVRCSTMSDYDAMTITPQQAFAIWFQLSEPESTLTLLAASTGLRISECLGLQWRDIDSTAQLIHCRRTWTMGKVGRPKSKSSKAAVPLHRILAEYMNAWHSKTPYAGNGDWVFPSFSLKGRQPRVANMLVEDHLRPAAVAAGVLMAGDKTRFGFHNLRHSLATFLVSSGKDPKTVQGLLRHAHVSTTLQIYAHSRNDDRMEAQGSMLTAIFAPKMVQ